MVSAQGTRRFKQVTRGFAGTDATQGLCDTQRMNQNDQKGMMAAAYISDDIAEHEALNGVPLFYDIPSELAQVIEKQVLIKERMFWLRATSINKDPVNSTLLRRAVYAEQRCWEMENRAGEMAIITEGAIVRVKELEKKLDEVTKATS